MNAHTPKIVAQSPETKKHETVNTEYQHCNTVLYPALTIRRELVQISPLRTKQEKMTGISCMAAFSSAVFNAIG